MPDTLLARLRSCDPERVPYISPLICPSVCFDGVDSKHVNRDKDWCKQRPLSANGRPATKQ
jgi:hypothetical protein